jgi:Serine/threonine protein kinase
MVKTSGTLPPGTIVRGPERSYTIIKVLGQGGFGITYLVSSKVKIGNIPVDVSFALKEHFISSLCSRDSNTHYVQFSTPVADEVNCSMRSFLKEAQRLQSLGIDHPNIVKINEVFEENNTAYYVMEYLGTMSLADYIETHGPLSADVTLTLLRPVVEAIAMLHREKIAHYDIKPNNIMLCNDDDGKKRPVLIDFGLSKHYNDSGKATSTITTAGYTPGFAPIEQYAGIRQFSPQCDVYALAAVFLFCLTGKTPEIAFELSLDHVASQLASLVPTAKADAILHALSTMPAKRTSDAYALLDELYDSQISKRPLNTHKTQIRQSQSNSFTNKNLKSYSISDSIKNNSTNTNKSNEDSVQSSIKKFIYPLIAVSLGFAQTVIIDTLLFYPYMYYEYGFIFVFFAAILIVVIFDITTFALGCKIGKASLQQSMRNGHTKLKPLYILGLIVAIAAEIALHIGVLNTYIIPSWFTVITLIFISIVILYLGKKAVS